MEKRAFVITDTEILQWTKSILVQAVREFRSITINYIQCRRILGNIPHVREQFKHCGMAKHKL